MSEKSPFFLKFVKQDSTDTGGTILFSLYKCHFLKFVKLLISNGESFSILNVEFRILNGKREVLRVFRSAFLIRGPAAGE